MSSWDAGRGATEDCMAQLACTLSLHAFTPSRYRVPSYADSCTSQHVDAAAVRSVCVAISRLNDVLCSAACHALPVARSVQQA